MSSNLNMVYPAEKIKRAFNWPVVRYGFYPRVGEMRNKAYSVRAMIL